MVDDEQGDPIVAAAKAMNLPADVLQRVLLFINPAVGQSVDRIYELATLYSEISGEAARRLVAILRDADPVAHAAAPRQGLPRQQGPDAARRAGRSLRNCSRPDEARFSFNATRGQARR